jgi:hypothetical protein
MTYDCKERKMKKMIRVFLVGMLCGVFMAAVLTVTLTIPGVDNHWRMEIWKRGGGIWLVDRNGHISWQWKPQPIAVQSHSAPRTIPRPQGTSDSSHEEL